MNVVEKEKGNPLQSLIINVADKAEGRNKSIEELSRIIREEYDKNKDLILDTLIHCVSEIPGKSVIYGTLIGLINVSNPDITDDIIAQAVNALQLHFDQANFFHLRLLVRFFGELVNSGVLHASVYLDLLNDIIEASKSHHVITQVMADHLCLVVLNAIPWCAITLKSDRPEKFEQLMEHLQSYIQHRKKKNMDFVKVFRGDSPIESEEFLNHFWTQIKQLAEKGWQVDILTRNYEDFQSLFKKPETLELLGLQLEAGRIVTSDVNNENHLLHSIPLLTFRIFDSLDNEKMRFSSEERVLVEELIREIMYFYEVNHRECVKMMDHLPLNKNIPLDYVIVECLFGKHMQLPSSEYVNHYYTTLLTDFTKLNMTSVPDIIQTILQVMFNNVDKVDVVCVHRLVDMLSIHLSNFNYNLDWMAFAVSLDGSNYVYQNIFIKELIHACIRLSYYDRIKRVVPIEMSSLLPPLFVHILQHHTHQLSKPLLEMVKLKKGDHELLALLNDNESRMNINNNPGENREEVEKIEMFVEVILQAGLHSFSSLIYTIQRYINVFKEFNKTPENRSAIINSVFAFWKNNPQQKVLIIDKLQAMRILDGNSIFNYLFKNTIPNEFSCKYVWEIVRHVIEKYIARVDHLQYTLHQEEKSLKLLKESGTVHMTLEKQREKISKIKLLISQSKTEERDIFKSLFSHFATLLGSIIDANTNPAATNPNENDVENNLAYVWISGYFREFLRCYCLRLEDQIDSLQVSVINEANSRVQAIFNEFKTFVRAK